MGISAHEVTLEQLADEIAEVYERCGFDRDATVTTLQMLTNIEVAAQHSCWFNHICTVCCTRLGHKYHALHFCGLSLQYMNKRASRQCLQWAATEVFQLESLKQAM